MRDLIPGKHGMDGRTETEAGFEYLPFRFTETMSEIRDGFPLLEETAAQEPGGGLEAMAARLKAVGRENLKEFAPALKGSELEMLVMLMKASWGIDTDVIEGILRLRFRKRLFYYSWLLLQHDYENPGLNKAVFMLAGLMKACYPDEYAATFIGRTESMEGSLPEKGKSLLTEEKTNIKSFCEKYRILEGTVLAHGIFQLFFIGGQAQDFLQNRELLIEYIRTARTDIVAPVLSAYLNRLKAAEYIDELNYEMLNRWGAPEDGGELWDRLTDSDIARFKAWQGLKRIERHFGPGSKRFRLWRDYFDRIRRAETDEAAGLAIMEFEGFVIVDVKDDAGGSYMYSKKYFSAEYERYAERRQTGTARWRIVKEHVADAREKVLNGKVSDIYRVGYDRVDLLYLKAILSGE